MIECRALVLMLLLLPGALADDFVDFMFWPPRSKVRLASGADLQLLVGHGHEHRNVRKIKGSSVHALLPAR
jgi:hypothetical protein